MMPTVSEELTERSRTLTAALYKGSLSAVATSLPPLAEALAPAAAEHWGLVKTLGRNIGHTMEELTDMGFALDALDKLVASKSKEIRAAACWALAEIGAERPDNISGLAYRLAKDEAWEVRDQIAAAYDERIGPAQPRSLFELMRRWSNDSDERVRRAPALSLIRRARRDRVPVLAILEVLRRDASIYVRKGVVYCLQQAWGRAENPNYGPLTPDSPAFLLRILRDWAKDANPNTRWVVAYTLAHTWVAPYLVEALSILRIVARDPNEMVQKAVTAALLGLRKLGSPLLRRTMEAWAAENYEPTVSQLARRVLADMPVEEEIAALSPIAPPATPPALRSRDGRAHAEGRAGNDGRSPNHRQRLHPGRPTSPPAAQNGSMPTPTRAEALAPLPVEAATPVASIAPPLTVAPLATPSASDAANAEQPVAPKKLRPNSKLRADAIRPYENSALEVAAPEAAPTASDAANVGQPVAPKKSRANSKLKAHNSESEDTAPDNPVVASVEASVEQPLPAPKKPSANSKLKTQNSKLEVAVADEAPSKPKKRRSNSALSTQHSALDKEAANG